MGVEAAIIAAVAVQAGSQIYAGVSAMQSGKAQESAAKDQARLAIEESVLEAERQQGEFNQFNALQQLGFLSSGLSLLGTPSAVNLGNKIRQAQEIKAIKVGGIAQSEFLKFQGATAAREGRARLISGIGSAVGSVGTGVLLGQQAGVFTPGTTPVTGAQESAATSLRF